MFPLTFIYDQVERTRTDMYARLFFNNSAQRWRRAGNCQ